MKTTIRSAVSMTAVALLGFSGLSVASDEEADAISFPQVEQKVKKLKKRVKQLETEVTDLRYRMLPNEVSVDCSAGDTVQGILDAHAETLGKLTIRVSGVCTEQVTISRSNVSLLGQAGAAIQQISPGPANVIVTNNAGNVSVSDLRLAGGFAGGIVNKGAHALFTNIVMESTSNGMMALDGGSLDLTGSTLRNNAQAVYAVRGGVIHVSNTMIEQNTIGVLAFKGGIVNLTSAAPAIPQSNPAGVILRNNNTGAVARSGGLLELSDSRVEANRGVGLLADSGGVIHLFNQLNGAGNTIVGNTNYGILLQKNSSLVISDVVNNVSGNGFGIQCFGNPSYIAPPGFVVTGNTNGNLGACSP